jgi:MOSC domain-containing protein YiiM
LSAFYKFKEIEKVLKIISINIVSPTRVSLDGSPNKVRSGYFKLPVTQSVYLGYQGFEGDGVGNTKIHGGEDKAVCAYSTEHFSYWADKLLRKILPGSFGENLSLLGMLETEVNIGDIFEMGAAQVQVSQPRQPCFKLNKVFKDQSMACSVKTTGFSGYYFRVLKPGLVAPSSLVKKIKNGSFSIEKTNALLRKGGSNAEQIQELISLPELSDDWRGMFQKRLNKLNSD